MISKIAVRKKLTEIKGKKEQLLTEEKIVKSRIMMIMESDYNIKNFDRLPKKIKKKLAYQIFEEINFLSENNILNESLGDFLSKIFGGSLNSIIETIIEPLLNSVLGGLGLTGYFKNFLISFLSSNPKELANSLNDCKAMTTLIANSLSEALFMMIQEQKGISGGFATFLRNALGGAVKDTAFVNKIEDFIGDMVCSGLSKISGNAEGVLNKLKNSGLVPGSTGQ
jgi:large-conductance mechanosensitive channel